MKRLRDVSFAFYVLRLTLTVHAVASLIGVILIARPRFLFGSSHDNASAPPNKRPMRLLRNGYATNTAPVAGDARLVDSPPSTLTYMEPVMSPEVRMIKRICL